MPQRSSQKIIRTTGVLAASGLCASLLAVTALPAHAAENAAPVIVPALQTWTGGQGTFSLDPDGRIVADSALADVAEAFAADLRETTGVSLDVAVDAEAGAGDLALTLDTDLEHAAGGERFAEEGYLLDVAADGIDITAPSEDGAFYATRTVLQALVQSDDRATMPVGETFDWPSYESRGFALDVGRRFFTADFIRDYIRQMSWYKLNEFHIHLNDNEIHPPASGWKDAYWGFRLQSENPAFAGLASTDGSYSRSDWQGFEDLAATSGMQIIPEIDVPAHSRPFIQWKPELGLNGGDSDNLDLTKPATTQVIKDVFTEFMQWFEGTDVHFGADEYPRQYAAEYRTFFNEMAAHVRSFGKQPRAWGSATVMTGGTEGYDRDVVFNSWNEGWYGLGAANTDGYSFINTNDANLYVVPFANYYHGNGLNNQGLYENWLPNRLSGTADVVPAGAPQGAMFAVWNDLVHADYTELDVHGLVRESFPVIAQKTWNAATPTLSYAQFTAATDTIGRGPGLGVIEQGPQAPRTGEVSVGAAVTASASDEGTPATALTDAMPNTRWATSENGVSFTIDLGAAVPTGRVEVDWAYPAPASFDVEVSQDGVFWQTIATDASGSSIDLGSANARHVRVADITAAGSTGASAWRASVFSPAPLTDGATATASGSEAAGFPASSAIDGNGKTRWSANYVAEPWIAVDLGAASTFDTVTLDWEAASATAYRVDVSTDGTSWTTAATRNGLAAGARTDVVDFDAVTARHVKVTVLAKTMTPYLSLYELTIPDDAGPRAQIVASISPAAADHADGWYTTAPEFAVAAEGTAGLATNVEYRVGDGEWSDATSPITLTSQGVLDLQYRATVGEESVTGHGTVRVDSAAPTVRTSVSDPGRAGGPLTVTFAAQDAGAGVAGVEYRLNGSAWTAWDGTALTVSQRGTHSVEVRATDIIGHISEVSVTELTVTKEKGKKPKPGKPGKPGKKR